MIMIIGFFENGSRQILWQRNLIHVPCVSLKFRTMKHLIVTTALPVKNG